MAKVKTKTTIAERIRARFNEFKPAERKIATHLLSNYPMAGLVSIFHQYLATSFARYEKK